MTLADTSAWIEFIRGRHSRASARMRDAIASEQLLTTDPVVMEVLAGARDEADERRLKNFLAVARFVSLGGLVTWERAAAIHIACRRSGVTPRSQIDCLIAAVAIREDIPVLHADRDFDRIARCTPLRVVEV